MPSPRSRLEDIKQRIGYIRELLDSKTMSDVETDWTTRAAFERFLEIISEASRHVPEDMRASYGSDIPWRHVAAVGNVLRHAYHKTSLPALWSIYTDDLDALEAAVDAMLAATPPAPTSS